MIEEAKALLDWVAGKEIWYWITIGVALTLVRGVLRSFFDGAKELYLEHRHARPSKKKTKPEPEGKWAKYE